MRRRVRPYEARDERHPDATARLPRHLSDRRDQLLDLVPLIGRVARGERVRDTVRDVIVQKLLNFMQRRPNRVDLRQYVHAIPVVFDHAQPTAHLTSDAPEPFGDLGLCRRSRRLSQTEGGPRAVALGNASLMAIG